MNAALIDTILKENGSGLLFLCRAVGFVHVAFEWTSYKLDSVMMLLSWLRVIWNCKPDIWSTKYI